MATRKIELGPSGRAVAANVARYRQRRGYTMRDLAEEMTNVNWPLSASAISQIENGARRVDVDDLMALSVALNTTPNLLLMPLAFAEDEQVETGPFGRTAASHIWAYLLLDPPPGDPITEWWNDPREKGLAPVARWLARVAEDDQSDEVWAAFGQFITALQSIERRAPDGND